MSYEQCAPSFVNCRKKNFEEERAFEGKRLQVRAQSFISLRLRAGPRRGLDARAHARPVLEHGVVVLARAVATRERAARARGAGGDERRGMVHVVERARLEDDRENEAKSADAIETTRRNGSNPSARGTRARLARVRRSTLDAETRRKNYATARSQLAKIKINASLTPLEIIQKLRVIEMRMAINHQRLIVIQHLCPPHQQNAETPVPVWQSPVHWQAALARPIW